MPLDKMPPVLRSAEYRNVFANAFMLRFGDNDSTVYFAFAEDLHDLEKAEQQVGVTMTPRSIKALSAVLLQTIMQFEHDTGTELPVQDEYKPMFDMLKANYRNPA